jgi:hypothetical protein
MGVVRIWGVKTLGRWCEGGFMWVGVDGFGYDSGFWWSVMCSGDCLDLVWGWVCGF